MAQASHSPKVQSIIDDLDSFDECLKGVYLDPWWRKFVVLLKGRRQAFMEELVSSVGLNQREEDMLRGTIRELTILMALDHRAEQLNNPQEKV